MPNTNEYLIFIHGVSDQNNQTHEPTYKKLHDGINNIDKEFPYKSQWLDAQHCYVEWGWNYDPPDENPQGHRLLAQSQENVAQHLNPLIAEARDFTLNPLRSALSAVRSLMLQGFSDMIFYASQDGRNSVRSSVASQILEKIGDISNTEDLISLTFLGHSAGSVVAFDFLFYLFADDGMVGNRFFDQGVNDQDHQKFMMLRQLAQTNKLRVRRLITFGSPISMLTFRNNAVLDILANGQKLNASHYGLTQNPWAFGEPLKDPRWFNIWDKDDIISWPVEPLIVPSTAIEDMYTDVGDLISQAHNQYWENQDVHRKIARYW